jgi:uncharacterized protein (DUF697 family)
MVESKKEKQQIGQEQIMKTLDWAYDQVLNGGTGVKSIYEMTDEYLKNNNHDVDNAIKSLSNYQTVKAAASGFLTGLGGVITLPVAIPANIASVLLFQMRMIASIALMRGYDLKSDQVQTFVYACLTGKSVSDILKGTGIIISEKLATSMIKKIPGTVLTKINQKVGWRLLTKFGEKGTINLVKLVPVAGGLVGATFDTASTRLIAKVANKTFTEYGIDTGDGVVIDI